MVINGKIKHIRKHRGMSQRRFAILMNCDPSLMSKMESGERRMSQVFLERARVVLDIEDVPLTDDEAVVFENKLTDWHILLKSGEVAEAAKSKDRLEFCVKWSFSSRLGMLFDLYSLSYYSAVRDVERAKIVIERLKPYELMFSPNQRFLYHAMSGAVGIAEGEYRNALKSLLIAEEADADTDEIGEGFFYNIVLCLTFMNYSRRAIEYIMKARERSDKTGQKLFEVYFDVLLAVNWANFGKINEALSMLKGALQREKMKQAQHSNIVVVYMHIAQVYMKAKLFSEAVNACDEVLDLCEKGDVTYLNSLWYKCDVLFEIGKIEEAEICLETGLSLSHNYSLIRLEYNILRHSRNLEDEVSLLYMRDFAIPRLAARGEYMHAIRYCDLLKDYYRKSNKYKPALECEEMARVFISKVLTEADF